MIAAMIIREAAPADYRAMSELFEQVDALHMRARPDVFCDPPIPGRPAGFFDSKRHAPDSAMFVAENDSLVVGCAIVRLKTAPAIPIMRAGRVAYLEDLVVAPERRRGKVGTALMRNVEEWARRQQAERIELTAWEFNRESIAFYTALGYGTSYRRMSRNMK